MKRARFTYEEGGPLRSVAHFLAELKRFIVLDLERLAINSRTLFPDLEGLARGIWQTEIIRQCFRDPGLSHS